MAVKYRCINCEARFLKWSGKCANCGEWESLEELAQEFSTSVRGKSARKVGAPKITKLSSLGKGDKVPARKSTGIKELDRVLGGGLVGGEVVLVGGHPGVGKSTLLSQVAIELSAKGRVLYVSGEESASQLSSRMKRLSGNGAMEGLDVTQEVVVEALKDVVAQGDYDLVIVDSIQSVVSIDSTGYAGGVSQVRSAGSVLVSIAKTTGVPFMVVGQINKDGAIAGPKVLEHLVDCVVYMEGGEHEAYRIVRCVKNRFGPTNEIGVFLMSASGTEEVLNPSEIFLNKGEGVAGSALAAVIRGSRVIVVEVQALVVERTGMGGPMRRVANGIRSQRLEMLVAVLSRHGGLRLGDRDVFVNVVGGLTLDDPIADLALCAAIKSSYQDKALAVGSVYLGEVGLTGGVRGVFGLERAIKEVGRLGYDKVLSPYVGKSASGVGLSKIAKIGDLR